MKETTIQHLNLECLPCKYQDMCQDCKIIYKQIAILNLIDYKLFDNYKLFNLKTNEKS